MSWLLFWDRRGAGSPGRRNGGSLPRRTPVTSKEVGTAPLWLHATLKVSVWGLGGPGWEVSLRPFEEGSLGSAVRPLVRALGLAGATDATGGGGCAVPPATLARHSVCPRTPTHLPATAPASFLGAQSCEGPHDTCGGLQPPDFFSCICATGLEILTSHPHSHPPHQALVSPPLWVRGLGVVPCPPDAPRHTPRPHHLPCPRLLCQVSTPPACEPESSP
ncbi:hypothetical protein HJG60_007743 [Phyllostomus discolor]|uniref:Uncharacterized protein n=1 Tax=Phyllostomus discolor TaxID=89673 RepID=A0A834ERI6_9CHIR|nr:hypothetical protein HJG60_007743 [Phyllostomus discolor]